MRVQKKSLKLLAFYLTVLSDPVVDAAIKEVFRTTLRISYNTKSSQKSLKTSWRLIWKNFQDFYKCRNSLIRITFENVSRM